MAELGDLFLSSHYKNAKNIDVTIEMLDYDHVKKCNSLPKLCAILQRLKSGKEGRYPHLEQFVEDKIIELLPEKENRKMKVLKSVPSRGVVKNEEQKLLNWTEGMMKRDGNVANGDDDIFSNGDDDSGRTKCHNKRLPPVRGSKDVVNESRKTDRNPHSSECSSSIPALLSAKSRLCKETMSNRDYFRAWDKFDVEEADKELDAEEREKEARLNAANALAWENLEKQQNKASISDDNDAILSAGETLTTTERKFMAEREKRKGNEYFKNSENEQAVFCYSRSIALDPSNPIVYANRAMASIRLDNLCQALNDCTTAIEIDPTYTKAIVRRGIIHHKCGRYEEAIKDFKACLECDEENKEYSLLLRRSQEKYKEVSGDSSTRKKKILIEEIDDDTKEEDRLEREGEHEKNIKVEKDEEIEEVFTPGAAALLEHQRKSISSKECNQKVKKKTETRSPRSITEPSSFHKVSIVESNDSDSDSDA